MSIDINWETLTTGPDGQELAHSIRDFIHAKFQAVALPRFIKSVTVHDFEFGAIPPSLELKDITDPLPDFYEENSEAESSTDEDGSGSGDDDDAASTSSADELRLRSRLGKKTNGAGAGDNKGKNPVAPSRLNRNQSYGQHNPYPSHLPPHLQTSGLHGAASPGLRSMPDLGSPFLGVSTPGIPGGTSNLASYFHSQFAGSLSGTQTPLAAVAGAHHWPEGSTPIEGRGVIPPGAGHGRHPSQSSVISDLGAPTIPGSSTAGLTPGSQPGQQPHPALREKHSVSTLAPTSVGTSRPPTRDTSFLTGDAIEDDEDDRTGREETTPEPNGDGANANQGPQKKYREPRVEDMQAVFRIRYSGDVKLLLTADILLDYPMPSFVGIPVRLSITGLTFDGVGVLAHIRRRVHFCFLSPDDAVAAVGAESEEEGDGVDGGKSVSGEGPKSRLGGLLQEIKVDSEIGQREPGKQSLKNVGKVERFVLEQVRRIFEEEFVYPSFWTVLV